MGVWDGDQSGRSDNAGDGPRGEQQEGLPEGRRKAGANRGAGVIGDHRESERKHCLSKDTKTDQPKSQGTYSPTHQPLLSVFKTK